MSLLIKIKKSSKPTSWYAKEINKFFEVEKIARGDFKLIDNPPWSNSLY